MYLYKGIGIFGIGIQLVHVARDVSINILWG